MKLWELAWMMILTGFRALGIHHRLNSGSKMLAESKQLPQEVGPPDCCQTLFSLRA